MKSIILPDGRHQLTLRQSSLKTFDICAERARRDNLDGAVQTDTDAAVTGTCVHAAIELDLDDKIQGGEGYSYETLLQVFNDEFTDWSARESFSWVKYSEAQARRFGGVCLQHWYEDMRPGLKPLEVEWGFNEILHEDDLRVIRLSGTIDLIDETGLVDWKTSGRGPYTVWEKQRWDVQGTAYTWARYHDFPPSSERESYDFRFGVMHANGIQDFTITRVPADWEWLKHKAVALSKLVEAELDQWPLNDDSALCSPKWCDHWDNCRGLFIGSEDPWGKNTVRR